MSKLLISEFIGTAVLVFAGCGAIIVETLTGALGHVGVALTFGFVVTAMIYTFGHVSGCHINPAVSIAFYLTKELDFKTMIYYLAVQFLGALFAAALLWLLFLENSTNTDVLAKLGSTIPRGSWYQSFVFEILLTFILMIVIFGSAIHGKAVKSFAGIAIGLTVGVEALFAGPISGASMNPARSFGPALMSGSLEYLWIYLIAPVVGSSLAAWVFVKTIKCNNEEECLQ